MNLEKELICERCGLCCWPKKLNAEGEVVLTGKRCEFQDPISLLCRIYDKRHTYCPTCVSIEQAEYDAILPDSCPYVALNKDYDCCLDYSSVL